MSIYNDYNNVKSKVVVFRNTLIDLYGQLTTLYNDQLPVLYIATADKKQFWFIQCETVTLNNDTTPGPYSISVLGCGVRAYFANEVDMSTDAGSFPWALETYANPSDTANYRPYWPSSGQDFVHISGMGSLTRYEVFGHLLTNITPQKMSVSDIIRNNTIGDVDDYLIGQIKNPHFVGNFARTASLILELDGLGPIPNPNPDNRM